MKSNVSKELTLYDLGDNYSLEKVNWQEFSVYFAVYQIFDDNIWFRQSFKKSCDILESCETCYFIKKEGQRIGGVLLEPNSMYCLILEPPYNDYDTILSKLKQLLLTWSDPLTPIVVGGVKPDHIHYYHRQGFESVESRRCMIRPTELFEIDWPNDIAIIQPDESRKSELSDLFVGAFGESGDAISKREASLDYYFEHVTKGSPLNKASTLLYDQTTHELVGACLISLWEEWPNVFDLAVKPSHQNKGFGTKMIKRVLTELKDYYPVLRLFVTLGNDAEMLYHKMGFLAGTETTEMVLNR